MYTLQFQYQHELATKQNKNYVNKGNRIESIHRISFLFKLNLGIHNFS